MKSLFICLLFVAAATLLTAEPFFKWTDCTLDRSRLAVQSITVTPDELKKGENVTISAKFTLMENITSGSKATAEVKVGGFLFENRTYDLCNTAVRRINMKCPVAMDQYNVTVTTLVPVMSPRGSYTAVARAMDPDGKQLVCVSVDFVIS